MVSFPHYGDVFNHFIGFQINPNFEVGYNFDTLSMVESSDCPVPLHLCVITKQEDILWLIDIYTQGNIIQINGWL